MVEATGVVPEGRISIGCPSIEDDAHADAFKPMINFAHSHDVKIGIQLAHAGRKAGTMLPWDDHRIAAPEEGGWQIVSSSAIAFEGYAEPLALTIPQIHQLTQDFAAAAARAVGVGFDVIELHAAHGYLFHQFYSPLANKRTDEYGGDFANRTRFLRETVEAVRKAIPTGTPLFVRISATDWVEGGWDIEESVALCRILKEVGVDLIDVSSGGLVHDAKITTGPGYQVPLAARIKKESNILTSAVGIITEAVQAEEIIESKSSDAVMIGRQMLRNPRWAISAAEELGEKIPWSLQLERSRRIGARKSPQ
jgi:2,4-dienoyl-CoA reductase-like NADH-dependent reductase (Old Yellow Enzyme family)